MRTSFNLELFINEYAKERPSEEFVLAPTAKWLDAVNVPDVFVDRLSSPLIYNFTVVPSQVVAKWVHVFTVRLVVG